MPGKFLISCHLTAEAEIPKNQSRFGVLQNTSTCVHLIDQRLNVDTFS